MKVLYTKITADICKKNRAFYKNHVRKAFIMWCAYEGYFDGVFTKSEIAKAKRGILPEDCNIHHKIPISGSDQPFINEFENLVVLHKNTHEQINKYIFSPQLQQLQNAPFGTTIEIDVPCFGYVDIEGIKSERAYCKIKGRAKSPTQRRYTNKRCL